MSLSVLVVSYNCPRLEQCLEALVKQPEAAEIVVSDCSDVDPTAALAPRFPNVQFLHFDAKQSVPQLRWAALRRTRGTVVASLEARAVPASDWCALLVRAHEQHPEAPVIGGPIALAASESARDLGLYFCEYAPFAPPVEPGPAPDVSGANVSYKREALERAADVLDAGQWETRLHQRWRSLGQPLLLSGATVSFENTMAVATILRQRFSYGRGYAASRLTRRSWFQRVLFAAGSVLLPALLTGRIGRTLAAKGRFAEFVRALPYIVLFNTVWAAGELTGYLFGDSGAVEIY